MECPQILYIIPAINGASSASVFFSHEKTKKKTTKKIKKEQPKKIQNAAKHYSLSRKKQVIVHLFWQHQEQEYIFPKPEPY